MLHGWGHIQPEAGPGASVSFSLLLGSSVDDDTDGVCAEVSPASPGQRRSHAPCQALPHQLRPLRRPFMLPAYAVSVSYLQQHRSGRSLARVRLHRLHLQLQRAHHRAHLAQLLHQPHVL